ncbi:MAG: SRPBCC domain-containing protein [Actinomycetota bacterium]|nr:SRPBCC domain-containing protein [Actinomycetota bacterium]
MATEINESFDVPNPDQAWGVITDINKLIPCVPGASVTSADGATKAQAEIEVDMGSMNMKFSGPVEIVEQDDSAKKAVVKASAKDESGQSNADGTVTITLGGDGGKVAGTANVTGKAASMGEGTVQAVLKQLIQGFGANLAKA